MKRFISYLLLVAVLPAFIFTGCKDETVDPATANYQTLINYLTANGMDLPDLLNTPSKWVVAPELTADGGIVDSAAGYTVPGYHVLDIRGGADFNAGHIPGSHNVLLADVITKANDLGNAQPYLIVCYSGQTAGRAAMALRLSGYEARVMKFGFSYWSSDGTFDKWSGKVSDVADNDPNWVMDASAALPSNDYPTWTSTTTEPADLLAERVNAMLGMEWGTSSANVLANPGNYNIYNYWDQATYESIGHYAGAYQFTTIDLSTVSALPTSDECQIYCYTGQTSSFTVAWLHVLGYNAKSITYGVNSLRHTALDDAGKPAWHHSKDYPYETTIK